MSKRNPVGVGSSGASQPAAPSSKRRKLSAGEEAELAARGEKDSELAAMSRNDCAMRDVRDLVEDDRGAGRGDTEDPWELQRLHDAWLEKEFFFKKKNNGAKKWPVKGRPDCGTLVSSPSMARHRRFYCKSRQPVALGDDRRAALMQVGRMLEEDDAYLGVIWLPHGQLGRRARSEAVASNPY